MPLHHVPAEPVARGERALEVHAAAGLPVAHRRAAERREHRGHREPAVTELPHREARAVDGDGLAGGQIAIRRADAELAAGIRGLDAVDGADIGDEACEHFSEKVRTSNRYLVIGHWFLARANAPARMPITNDQ